MDLVKPQKAIDFWKTKEVVTPEKFATLDARAKALAFSATKVADENINQAIYDSISDAMDSGMTMKDWFNQFDSSEFSKGYLETVFRTNMATAYSAGRASDMFSAEGQARAQYWMFSAIGDEATDEVCMELDGKVFDKTDYEAMSLIVPLHYNCRCQMIELDAEDLADMGLEVSGGSEYSNNEDIDFDNTGLTGWL